MKARLGDSPVFDKPVETEGLFTLIYQTNPERLTYTEWAKFDKFAKHKAFKLPSAIVPAENNIIINTRQLNPKAIRIIAIEDFYIDERLMR